MFIENESNPLRITMTEGDFGITLPIELIIEDKETISNYDNFVLNIYKTINSEPIVSKTYTDIQDNTIEFSLTEQESLLLPVGKYYYDLDWYQNEVFMCNLVAKENFSVIEKAGVVNES